MTFLRERGRLVRSAGALLVTVVMSAAAAGCAPSGGGLQQMAAHSPGPTPAGLAAQPTESAAPASPSAGATDAPSSEPTSPAPPAAARGDVLLDGGAVVLPDRAWTPGAANPQVTQANIHATICRTGFTSTIRPSSSYTTKLKEQQLASGYAFRGDTSTSDYEEDHLISLELGGAPADPHNLWPEPYDATDGARVKDRIENKLHDLVCSGSLTLAAAQQAIATNWWDAYQRYGGEGSPTEWDGAYGSDGGGTPTTTKSATPAPGETASPDPSGATAQCVDGTYSYSQHRSGTCSHHGGVARWIRPPPS
jgi:hypothetical protein